ncbi:hypothetical protein PR202_ga03838 [Eleusine coracana subsp. coracana]|uniref:Uncharacterized protein n=1 Tax=Eleusine coracana subsp. coracana TaxID=191504 RepID=A0AAV5BQF1_ELECO|nr:hypothetical protein PR202_ga03838 [Eleusine coracana subsp. coracana]
MANPLAGLQDHVKLAREYALEGLYDTSIIFFDGAIAQINKHLTTLDDALTRTKWMNCKKAISEEVEVVKQLDAQLKSLKEAPGTSRSSSPPIRSNKSFVFQPLDEYPTSSPSHFDDPDVWAPPPRDTPNRRRRLEKRIYIPLPDFESRKALIKINLRTVQIAADVDIDDVARKTEGYSGEMTLQMFVVDASMNGMRRKIAGKTRDEIKNMSKDDIAKDPVAMCDFVEALGKVQKSVSPADIEKHEKWMAEFGSA